MTRVSVILFLGISVSGICTTPGIELRTRLVHTIVGVAEAQSPSRSATGTPLKAPPMLPSRITTVDLPPGEKFLQFIPGNSENVPLGSFTRSNAHIVSEKRPRGEKPRTLSVFASTGARSWELELVIQEH